MVIGSTLDPIYKEQVIPALLRLKEKSPEACLWSIDDVTSLIESDQWMLIYLDDMFVILEEDGDYLHCAIAAAFNGCSDDFLVHVDTVVELARTGGYKGFTFTTRRRGWIKAAPKAGFKLIEATYFYGCI